ncbi:lysosomal proton-coupled steroid conjugate and bile acid symporter SLC46A3-like [Saccostrea cucullata]|uniref:lysosomal proton-coupled steroid conjugate and bile acid symporter SLC46A3-like n=1 Tax=Saccostrea cuccullata TaxID=36930 RepID=UPI002ED23766
MTMLSSETSIIIVYLVFFLYKTGESMLDATTRPYLLRAACNEIFEDTNNKSICMNFNKNPEMQDMVQKKSGNYLIYYRLLLNLPAIVIALFSGSYSDRYGRKTLILFPSVGSMIAVFLYFASNMVPKYRILLILVGSAVQGLFGKSSLITTAVNSLVFDLSEEKNRTKNFGRLLAMNMFGLTTGALFSGVFQDVLDVKAAFGSVVVLHGTAILITAIFIGEVNEEKDKSKNKDTEDRESACAVCEVIRPSSIKETFAVIYKSRSGKKRHIIVLLLVLSVIIQTCKVGEMDVKLMFVTRSPLSWPKSWYGYLLSLDYAVIGVCLLLLMPMFSNQFKFLDVTIMMLGIGSQIAHLTLVGVSDKSWMVFASVAVGAFKGMIISALRSIISKSVHADEVGKMFSLITCGETLSKFLGTLIFVNIYSTSAHIFPGIVFFVEAATFIIILVILIAMYRHLHGFNELTNDQVFHGNDFKQSITKEEPNAPKFNVQCTSISLQPNHQIKDVNDKTSNDNTMLYI